MARQRRSNTNKKTKRSTRQNKGFMKVEIGIISLFVVSVILFISNINLAGSVGVFLKGVQLGLFGYLGYVFPFLLFAASLFYISNKHDSLAAFKTLAAVALFLTLASIIHIFKGDKYSNLHSIADFYTSAKAGGVFGGIISSLFSSFIGNIGSIIIFLAIIIICAVYITEKSFISIVKSGSNKAYNYAKEDIKRRKQLYEQRVLENKTARLENKVSGIDLASTDLRNNQDGNPAVDEYIPANMDIDGNDFNGTDESTANGIDLKTAIEEETLKSIKRQESDKEKQFSTPEISIKKNRADIFTGNILKAENNNSEIKKEEIDNETIDRVRDILSRREEIEREMNASTFNFDMKDALDTTVDAIDTYEDEEDYALDSETVFDAVSKNNSLNIDKYRTDIREYADDTDSDDNTDNMANIIAMKGIHSVERSRQIVTAGGKIINSDTEDLFKKAERTIRIVSEDEDESEQAVKANSLTNNISNISVIRPIKAPEEKKVPKKAYIFPPTDLLEKRKSALNQISDEEYEKTAIKLQQTLSTFGVNVTVTNISCGPSVTRYELKPEPGVKVSKILSLSDDIQMSLAASDIRIEAPIPGKSAVGIEVPNAENTTVYLRELFETKEFRDDKYSLGFAVGKDIGGQTVVTDIAKTPHLLIAGATGSGKSVCINTLIMSLLYKYSPDDVKLIMVDPKVVELSIYNGIPHLLIPVVTDPKKAAAALNWAVSEMDSRYSKFEKSGVRNLAGYNEKLEKIRQAEDIEELPEKMYKIVIIIDELADLMMVAKAEVEDAIVRLAQKARACGIHLVLATQRPSVDVITGLIKANVPSRIAFKVSSGIDSRTIIDGVGAEKLLGRGDMLFSPQSNPKPTRVQGAFLSDEEVQNVVDFIAAQEIEAQTDEAISGEIETAINAGTGLLAGQGENDELFISAGRFIIEKDKASIGYLQRAFKIGFNRAARIMDQLFLAGVVGEEQGTKPRQILMSSEEFEAYINQ